MSDLHQNGPDLDLVGLPPSVRRYVYEGKDQFFRILQLERKRLLDSMPNSHGIADTHTASGSNKLEQIEITEYIIFSINPTTFHQDFLGPDPFSLFFNPSIVQPENRITYRQDDHWYAHCICLCYP
jgi:hypothetical protein